MTSIRLFGLPALALSMVIGSAAGPSRLQLPDQFVNYKRWTQLLTVPFEVPLELWVRCVAPTPTDWSVARKRYGPHTKRFIRIYGNRLAEESLASGANRFRGGSVIVKEKLTGNPHGDAEGAAFMVKRNSPAFASTGGWEFLYYPPAPDKQKTHESCASCHRGAAERDYVFGKYPR